MTLIGGKTRASPIWVGWLRGNARHCSGFHVAPVRRSDSPTVPAKSLNQAEQSAAEAMEGRGLAKGNSPERNALWTQGQGGAPSALERVRQAARKDRKQRFTALLHHIYDVERLRRSSGI